MNKKNLTVRTITIIGLCIALYFSMSCSRREKAVECYTEGNYVYWKIKDTVQGGWDIIYGNIKLPGLGYGYFKMTESGEIVIPSDSLLYEKLRQYRELKAP
jgi:hypothetical protein